MADKESNDVLMTFIDSNGRGVAAECTSAWDEDDVDMMQDFEDGKFFEVDDFDFGVNLGEDEGGGDGGGSSFSGNLGENSLHAPPGHGGAPAAQNAEKKKAKSSSKRFAKYLEGGDIEFKPEVKEVTITKQVDMSSVRFLQSCLTYAKFQKAVLVKRKFTGGFDFHEAFLRIEFKEPLITGIDWDEGDVVKEKIRFICRGITVAYKPQNNDGSLGDARSASWNPPRKLAASSR
jgi:type VI protein secretion system component Hcp